MNTFTAVSNGAQFPVEEFILYVPKTRKRGAAPLFPFITYGVYRGLHFTCAVPKLLRWCNICLQVWSSCRRKDSVCSNIYVMFRLCRPMEKSLARLQERKRELSEKSFVCGTCCASRGVVERVTLYCWEPECGVSSLRLTTSCEACVPVTKTAFQRLVYLTNAPAYMHCVHIVSSLRWRYVLLLCINKCRV